MDYAKGNGDYRPFKFTFEDGLIIEIIHDVHKHGLSILELFEEWYSITEERTVESFCEYIMTQHKKCLAFPKATLT
tara:strand:+ start:59 stop:286 length:228 start_codon:yes stop_codon:yes gene_type:complete